MKHTPKFRYFVSDTRQAVLKDSAIWNLPIPQSRHPHQAPPGIAINHGDYFDAVRNGLQKADFKLLLSALSQSVRRDVALEEIEEIRIVLEKHGEYYHPARVETTLPETTLSFVLNVAVSDTGKNYAAREYQTLKKLHAEISLSFLPRVYGEERGMAQDGHNEVSMFLGEWFEGYHEFHISRDPSDDILKIIVWDGLQGSYFLGAGQTRELYRQAAKILTSYFNLITFECISSWHHAAGDFVIKCDKDHLDVKLITVRQYGPMFAGAGQLEPDDPDVLLEALLVFFLNLAIRMRLDRLDGVGEIVWADKIALKPTIQGFLEALALKPPLELPAETLVPLFRKHLFACRPTDLLELNRAIVHKMHPEAPDVVVVQKHLEQHVNDLYAAIQSGRVYP